MADDIVTQLREHSSPMCGACDTWGRCGFAEPCDCRCHMNFCREAANEIERLRAENEAIRVANHKAMWDDTLVPIANAFGLTVHDEHGALRRQFQMVEAIIKEARRG